jgi:nucleoid DNA-binding protein
MNRSEFTRNLQENMAEKGLELSLKDAKMVYEAFVDTMVAELTQPGGKVPLAGLMNLTNRVTPEKPARIGRNPATGEQIEIGPKGPSVKLKMSALLAYRNLAAEVFDKAEKQRKKAERAAAKAAPAPAAKAAPKIAKK